jgi:acetoin:2,6-dichlorophenolindophenol oxidoreductase subunit alpha
MENTPSTGKSRIDLSSSDLLNLYRLMALTREFEMRIAKIATQRSIVETPHLCVGEEAIGVGACYGLRTDDFVLPTLRGRSVFLTKGVSPAHLMAGVFGKATGPARGKWTSHHMGDLDKGILAGSLIIGSQFPTAVGAAMAFKLKKTDQVCLCFFGDGASNRGDFHEGLNMAAILNLPVVFICENNGYALYTPVEQNMRIKDISARAQGYGMPGVTIDGNDVLEVHHTVREAVELARQGGGPSLIECKTYRLRPHCEKFQEIRPKEELDRCWEFCPIDHYREYLLDRGILNRESDRKILREVEEEIDQAVKFAEESPFPEPGEIFEDVYADGVIRGGRLCVS